MFEVQFKTSEEAGALYGTEDLLKISLDSDDLKSFLRKWESVLTGMGLDLCCTKCRTVTGEQVPLCSRNCDAKYCRHGEVLVLTRTS